ncbi:MAG: hypothetical protein EBU90_10135 [Proteobacteria bacterium]|nr:hypothetical protein [Pseudomonadota bacterium]
MISITCIDALNYAPTIRALKSTLGCIPVSRVYWFSDVKLQTNDFPVTNVKIKRFKRYTDEYNYITLKLIPHIVTEPYNLIIHSDGFAVNENAWDDEFLKYDYIGAKWNNGSVGNGGFCLRSRKLYDALLDLEVKSKTSDYPDNIINDPENYVFDAYGDKVIPEDNIICKIHRKELEEKYDIKFAEGEIADKFSIEHNMSSPWLGKSLGFHGKHGIAKHYGVEL